MSVGRWTVRMLRGATTWLCSVLGASSSPPCALGITPDLSEMAGEAGLRLTAPRTLFGPPWVERSSSLFHGNTLDRLPPIDERRRL